MITHFLHYVWTNYLITMHRGNHENIQIFDLISLNTNTNGGQNQ